MSKRNEWLAGLLLAGFGVVFALAALEAGVRLLHLVPDRFWEPDPDRGVRLVAGRSGWWTQEDREFTVPIQINSHALRDVEHEWDKPAGSKRVLIVGDSFIEAMHVPLAATIGRQLEPLLNDGRTQRVEVIEAGVSGYGTAAQTIFFEKQLRRYQADIVVLALYPGNDVKNNSPTLEDYLQPQYAADGTLQRIVNKQKIPRAGRSKAFQFVRQTILRRQPALASRLTAWGVFGANAIRQAPQRDGIPLDYGVYAKEMDAEWRDAWTKTEQLLERLRKDVEETGARLLVMIVSSRDQVYPASWEQVVRNNVAMQQKQWDLDAPQRRVESWCREQGVPYVALTPAFKQAAASGGELLHYPQDGHWTAAGHKLAATVIQKHIHDMGL